MESYRPERIFVEKAAQDLPLTKRIRERFTDISWELIDDVNVLIDELKLQADPISLGKKWLLITTYPGEFLKKCPGTQGFICCNYSVLNAATGCPLDCSYCVLQSYLYNNPLLKVFANTADLFGQLDSLFSSSKERQFRVGTGELSDSLALDPMTGFSMELVTFFGQQENAMLELKTKTDHVENLLDLPHHGKTVVGWSVNPESLIASDEKGCATLQERLSAAETCRDAGYRISFHFDPIFFGEGWEKEYAAVVERIFTSIEPSRIAWISLGGLRFPPDLKPILRRRFPRSRLITGEHVPCPDNKLRFVRPLRVHGYRQMVRWIRKLGPQVPIYLCMEGREVWEAVFENVPARIENLAGIF